MKIPVLTKSISLTGVYEEGVVEIKVNPPVGPLLDAIEQFQKADKADNSQVIPAVNSLLIQLIASWNFETTEGIDIPVSIEGFKMLPADLLIEIATRAQDGVVTVPLA